MQLRLELTSCRGLLERLKTSYVTLTARSSRACVFTDALVGSSFSVCLLPATPKPFTITRHDGKRSPR